MEFLTQLLSHTGLELAVWIFGFAVLYFGLLAATLRLAEYICLFRDYRVISDMLATVAVVMLLAFVGLCWFIHGLSLNLLIVIAVLAFVTYLFYRYARWQEIPMIP